MNGPASKGALIGGYNVPCSRLFFGQCSRFPAVIGTMFPVPGWFWWFPAYNCFRDLMKLLKYFYGSMCTFRAILDQNMITWPQENSTTIRRSIPLKPLQSNGALTKEGSEGGSVDPPYVEFCESGDNRTWDGERRWGFRMSKKWEKKSFFAPYSLFCEDRLC